MIDVMTGGNYWYLDAGPGQGGVTVAWRLRHCTGIMAPRVSVAVGVAFCAPTEPVFDQERGRRIAKGRLSTLNRGDFGRVSGGGAQATEAELVADLLEHVEGPGWWRAWWEEHRGECRTSLLRWDGVRLLMEDPQFDSGSTSRDSMRLREVEDLMLGPRPPGMEDSLLVTALAEFGRAHPHLKEDADRYIRWADVVAREAYERLQAMKIMDGGAR